MKMKLWIPQKKNSFPLFNREISRFYPYNTMLLGKDSTKSIVIDSVEKIKIEWRDCWNLPHSFYLKVRGKYEFQYVFKATTGNKSFYFVGVEEMDRDDSSSMYTINKFISESFVKEKIKEEKANNEKK